MHQYAAILGHQSHLSLAELVATIPGFALESIEQKVVVLFSSSHPLSQDTVDQLGGTILLAERVTTADVSMADIPKIMANEVEGVKKKVTFGLRCYGIPRPQVKTAYIKGKQIMKDQKRPCRYVGNEKKAAATALLHSAQILNGKKGVEMFIIQVKDTLWVGKTIAAQDIDAYTWRDMEKPVRDTTVGLLPPKLAQIMLNLGASMVRTPLDPKRKKLKKEVYTVLDPFCGTGVIPLECLLRGWNILASDITAKAVSGTQTNIDWLRKEKKILKKDVSDSVSKHDAEKPFTYKTLPDMVVTETSLGPNLERSANSRDATKMRNDNEKLQVAFLKNAAETLPGVPLVCTWPFWKVKGEAIHLEKIWKALDDIGYKAILPEGIEADNPERPSLLYQRTGQFVGREVVMLQPKPNKSLE
ncbi:hypothetical protein COU75_01300 [Candidatus Peregrinibacteria bacterium CG10_big_fil_rev_8_21_14_0_10_42_8]|nr:MAG: hypothetical protein COU75_01300 [Candidatus Peregrinibacteria bacterium CG10_big_fil_rev_8_21_14_0_10_42_8]